MLPISLLPVVEHRLSPPSYGVDKRRPATHELGVLWVLHSHHLPDQTDLIIIELDTEDELYISRLFLSYHPFFFFLFFASVRYRSGAAALRSP